MFHGLSLPLDSENFPRKKLSHPLPAASRLERGQELLSLELRLLKLLLGFPELLPQGGLQGVKDGEGTEGHKGLGGLGDVVGRVDDLGEDFWKEVIRPG